MLLWVILSIVLCLLAAGFILWPLLGDAGADEALVYERSDVNLELYNEHKAELDRSLAQGLVDQQQYEALLRELDLSLLEDESPSAAKTEKSTAGGRGLLWGLMPVLLVGSVIWYWQLGAVQDVEISQLASEKYISEMLAMRGDEQAAAKLQELPKKLMSKVQKRLEAQPENTQYWYLLARTSMEQGAYAQGVAAYSQILQREPEQTQIMAELAQAMFLAAGNRIDPSIDGLVARVLAVDNRNPTALGLAGISAFERKAYPEAITYWQSAVTEMGAGAPGSQALSAGILRAQELAGSDIAPTNAPDIKVSGQDSISVYVSLAPSIKAEADQTVFVYARAWQGAKMPLAIVRLQVSDLPKRVVLDESMAMAAGMGLKSADQLQLIARLSLSGGVAPSAGDWQASFGPVDLSANSDEIELVIDELIE